MVLEIATLCKNSLERIRKMEVWMLLAAAGSSYLARCWQNAQKIKSTGAEEDERRSDGKSNSSSIRQSQLPILSTTRGKFRRFSPTGKSRFDNSFGRPNWGLANRQSGKGLSLVEDSVSEGIPDRKDNDAGRFTGSGRGEHNVVSLTTTGQEKSLNPEDVADAKMDTGQGIRKNCHSPILDAPIAVKELGCCTDGVSEPGVGVLLSGSQHEFASGIEANGILDNAAVPSSSLEQTCHVHKPSDCESSCAPERNNEIQREYHESIANCEGRALNSEASLLTDTISSSQVRERSLGGKRSNDHVEEATSGTGESMLKGVRGKRMKDASDHGCHAEEQMIHNGDLMSGLWDPESLFGYDVFSLPTQQGGEARRKGSRSRRSKTPNKFGNCRDPVRARKGLIATSKPVSSLESCLSAQLIRENEKTEKTGLPCPLLSFPSAGSDEKTALDKESLSNVLIEMKSLSSTDDYLVNLSGADRIIGLPALSNHCRGNYSLNEEGRTKKMMLKTFSPVIKDSCLASKDKQTHKFTCSRSEGPEVQVRRGSVARGTQSASISESLNKMDCHVQDLSVHSHEGLLFNFGVGVGMMFTSVSNRREVKKLTELLRQTQGLVRELWEEEVVGRDTISPGENNFMGLEDVKSADKQADIVGNVKKCRSFSRSSSSMRLSLSDDYWAAVKLEPRHSKDMAKLEAELEAEFERMEFNSNIQCNPKDRRSFSSSSEADPDIVADVVHGELTVRDLPCDVEVDSEDNYSRSAHDEVHMDDYAVSPWELERRLHEVLEARQDERIKELETELDVIYSSLQAKEQELQWWKNQFSHGTNVISDGADCNSTPELLKRKKKSCSDCELLKKYIESKEGLRNEQNIHHFTLPHDDASEIGSGSPEVNKGNIVHVLQDTPHSPLESYNISCIEPGSCEINKESLAYVPKVAAAAPTPSEASKATKDGKLDKVPGTVTLAGNTMNDCSDFYNEGLNVSNDVKLNLNTTSNKYEKPKDSAVVAEYLVQEASALPKTVNDGDVTQTPISQHKNDVDLLAAAENCCSGWRQHVPEYSAYFCENLCAQSRKSAFGVRTEDRFLVEEMASSHPDPEPELSLICGSLLSIAGDTAVDASGSSRCSVKCMDANILTRHQPGTYLSGRHNLEICVYDSNRCSTSHQKSLNSTGTNTPVANDQGGEHFNGKSILSGRAFYSSWPPVDSGNVRLKKDFWGSEDRVIVEDELGSNDLEGSDDISDLDEQIGRLLIEQIVEKTRRGSPILKEAQTVLASLERIDGCSGSFTND